MNDVASGSLHLSCEYLEGRLDLASDSIDVCCGFASSPIKIPFQDFTIDRLKQLRLETFGRIYNGKEQVCLSCPQLKPKTWMSNGLIKSVNIHHFTKCNLKCVYCFTVLEDQAFIKSLWENKYSAYDILKSVIDAGELSKDAHVIWAGGEPTITAEFDSVIDLITEYGAYIDVYTNCVRYSESLASAIVKNPEKVFILCSVDAGTAEIYRRVKGANVLAKVWDNIHLYNRDRSAVTGKYIFYDDSNRTQVEIEAFIAGCRYTGVTRIIIDADGYQVRGNNWVTPAADVDAVVRMGVLALENDIAFSYGEGVRCPETASREIIARAKARGIVPNRLWQPHVQEAERAGSTA